MLLIWKFTNKLLFQKLKMDCWGQSNAKKADLKFSKLKLNTSPKYESLKNVESVKITYFLFNLNVIFSAKQKDFTLKSAFYIKMYCMLI